MSKDSKDAKDSKDSKDSLVKGTLILTLAALVARALGVVQRIPLVYLLGDIGMAAYGIAFNLYSLLLVVATAGIPSALSKMISERTSLGRHEEADRIYRAALWFAAIAGVVMTAIMYAGAPYFARSIINPQATLPIQAIAPALLLFPLIAIMRGYFQGRRMMMPGGISQIIEQIFRVATSVVLAYLLLSHSLDAAVAGASFGGVMGSVAAAAVMLYYALRLRRRDRGERAAGQEASGAAGAKASAAEASASGARAAIAGAPASGAASAGPPLSFRAIYAQLFKLSVPIVIFSMTVTLIYTIDSSIVTLLLKDQTGEHTARELLGILTGRAQSLAGIPIILAVALSQSIVPIISGAYSQNDLKQVSAQTSKVLQLALLSGLPMVLLIALGARPLNGFIFGNSTGSAVVEAYAGPIIAALTVSAIFQIVMQTSGAVLMGMGRMKPLVLGVAAGIAVKLLLSFALAPLWGIYGIIAATAACFILMTAINVRVLHQAVPFQVFTLRRWGALAVSTALVVLAGLLADWTAGAYIRPFASLRANDLVQAVVVCGIVGVLYTLLLFATRVMTLQELNSLPGPLRKLLKPLLSRLPGARKASDEGQA
ncbi:stage V sporulation protein B [Paenibacillus sp. UNCCL117]|uniref:putative polysaccharide biosynthesis protein n=1 Tax=unclassified Paenibacillus TaxID=185978 RepID=UPI00088E0858|nr:MULTISPECIES: polysaccharide biosynthesis protein [unclassified Paenibacillus]SDE03345.1 stage V sporulation protein B [Paenibacillus sp. cl123]SFW57392.1 stage V sporulation protein B [Paenibacillus sp. UNCCL117]